MKKRMAIWLLACMLIGTEAFATRPQVVLGPGTGGANFRVPYHQTFNRVLSPDTTYILTGWYFVDSTKSVTIPAGTLIRGDSASGGALIIKRGAQIFAQGTAQQPVVFTSNKPAGTRTPGDWGGVVILGSATTNKPTTQQIEGGFGTIANSDAQYGGSNDADNSGILQYVRIEFGGIAYATDNEINGLTMGGVGSGTTIDHVQASFSNDDSFEWFGGTVQAKHLVAWQGLDDDIDTDFGFNGKLQFVYTKRNPNIFDASASSNSNGFESDNEGTAPYSALPRTKARISNATIIGPAVDSAAALALTAKFERGALLRRATEFSIYNSVLVGWLSGIQLKDTLTQRAAIDGRLEVRHTSIAFPRNMLTLSSSPSTGNIPGFDVVAWYTTGTGNNGSTARQSLDVGLTSAAFNLNATNNPVPTSGSELATAGTALDGRLTGDAFFTNVSYRGAFDPALPMSQQWTAGWTNFDPQNYDPEASTSTIVSMNNGWNLVSVPSVPASFATASLFPTAVSGTVNSFITGAYTQPATLVNGEGYWAFYSAATNNTITGTPITSSSVTVTSGNRWVLVGSVTASVPASSLTSNPPGAIVGGTLYGWNGAAYSTPTTLEPGKGYWVFVNTACTLTVGP